MVVVAAIPFATPATATTNVGKIMSTVDAPLMYDDREQIIFCASGCVLTVRGHVQLCWIGQTAVHLDQLSSCSVVLESFEMKLFTEEHDKYKSRQEVHVRISTKKLSPCKQLQWDFKNEPGVWTEVSRTALFSPHLACQAYRRQSTGCPLSSAGAKKNR